MKKMLLILLSTAFGIAAHAQTGEVSFTVTDAANDQGIAGAVIELMPTDNPEKKSYYTSGYEGSTAISGLEYGSYKMVISFLGYEDKAYDFKVGGTSTDLGRIALTESTTKIETVVKEVKTMRTSQKGDTVSYNAEAFKVSADADVEGLLKKMPGITVTDGSVEAQGEEVKKIFVDGKEFFGEDVSTAIKSLPAESVKSIEVYNKLSDNAEFSGMDDGEGYKAINIVTHENMRQGIFGQVYAGYGYQPDTDNVTASNKYMVGGNVNLFQNRSRLTLIGLLNNVNQTNFGFEDILGVSGGGTGRGGGMGRGVGSRMGSAQSGVADVASIGANLTTSWGENDKVRFEGSYFYNRTNTDNLSQIIKWYEAPSPIDTLSTSGFSQTLNANHRFNAKLDWDISANQSLMSRTSFSYQGNDPLSNTYGTQTGESGYNIIDNASNGRNSGYSLTEGLIYRARLGKAGRTLTLDGNISYFNNGDNETFSHSNIETQAIAGSDGTVTYEPILRYLYTTAPSSTLSLRANMTYTEPIAKYAQVSMQYSFSYNGQDRDNKTYVANDSSYDITGVTPDVSLSNAYNSVYTTHRAGPGIRYSKNGTVMTANLYYQYSKLDGDTSSERISHSYNNLTYFMMGNFNINSQNTIRLFVNSMTENPSITRLQGIYDVSDAQYISRGNPLLNPSYSNMVNFHYINSNVEKGRTFMWMFSMQNTSDYITTSTDYNTTIDVDNGDGTTTTYNPLQYTTYTNMDGYWNLRTNLSYGLPVGFLSSNLNLRAGVSYSQTPTLINGAKNIASTVSYDTGIVLGSNISENVDFTLSWNGTYYESKNSLAAGGTANRYFNHTASGNLKLVLWGGFTFTASAAYNQYIGFTNDYNEQYLLCNAYIGKKVFRSQLGEILVGVNDIFNQNTAFARTTGSGYTQNAWNSVIGRYFSIKFNYNIRHFGKNASKNIVDYDMGSSRRGPGMGGPGGPGPR